MEGAAQAFDGTLRRSHLNDRANAIPRLRCWFTLASIVIFSFSTIPVSAGLLMPDYQSHEPQGHGLSTVSMGSPHQNSAPPSGRSEFISQTQTHGFGTQ